MYNVITENAHGQWTIIECKSVAEAKSLVVGTRFKNVAITKGGSRIFNFRGKWVVSALSDENGNKLLKSFKKSRYRFGSLKDCYLSC